MSFRLFSISSIYFDFLNSFYFHHSEAEKLSFEENINLLLEDSTEFVAAYIRSFRKLGIDADCVIANNILLQKKWRSEKGLETDRNLDILFDQVNYYKPDILWIENLNYINTDWLNSIRLRVKSIRLIIAHHCSPFNKKIIDNLKAVDFIITCTPGFKSMIENLGKRSYLVYHGFDTDLLARINREGGTYKNDFVFSGSLTSGGDFHNFRIRLIEQILREDINIGLYVNLEKRYKIHAKQSILLFTSFLKRLKLEKLINKIKISELGNNPVETYSDELIKKKRLPVYGIDMYNLFNQSKIVLNSHIGIAGDYAGNMRMFEVTGIGSCLLTDNKKNMSDLYDIDSEVVVYDSIDDCIAKAKWLLNHADERKKIALAGQKRTLKSHTVEDRCRSIIEIINNELKLSGQDR